VISEPKGLVIGCLVQLEPVEAGSKTAALQAMAAGALHFENTAGVDVRRRFLANDDQPSGEAQYKESKRSV